MPLQHSTKYNTHCQQYITSVYWKHKLSRQHSTKLQNMSSRISYPWDKIFLMTCFNDDVIKWKHFPLYWSFVRGIHRSPVNSPHKGQWCGALLLSLICAWINGWVNNQEAGALRRHRAHYDVIVICILTLSTSILSHSDAIILIYWESFKYFFKNDSLMWQPLYTAMMSYFSTLFSTTSAHINSAKWCLQVIDLFCNIIKSPGHESHHPMKIIFTAHANT